MYYRVLTLLWLLTLLIGVERLSAQALPSEIKAKRVLLFYPELAEMPVVRAIDSGLREAFVTRGGVEVFAEYLDFSRFPAEQQGGPLIELLHNRYSGRELDLVVATSNMTKPKS